MGRVSRLRSTINARLEQMSFRLGVGVSAGALVIGGTAIALVAALSGGLGTAPGGAPAAHVTLRPALVRASAVVTASASPMATYPGGSSGYPRPSPSSATASPSPNPATRLTPHPFHTVPPHGQNPPSPPDPFQPPWGWGP